MLFRNDKKDSRDASAAVVPLLPLRELIVFPHEVYPIFVGRQKSIKALEAAEAKKQPILLVAQKDAKVAEPTPQDLYGVGTLGIVVQLLRLPDGTVKALLEGKKRARVVRYLTEDEYFQVEAEEVEELSDRTTEVEALMRSVVSTFDNYARLNKKIPPEMVASISSVDGMPQAGRTTREDPGVHAFRAGNPGSRKAYPLPGQEADGEDPEGVLPQRADARDPEGARREGRIQERDPGTRREAPAEEDASGGSREVRARDQKAQDDVADVSRGDSRAQLSRLVSCPAVVRIHRRQ